MTLSDSTQLRKHVPYPVFTTPGDCNYREPCDEQAAQSQNVEEAFGRDHAVPKPHMLHACTEGRHFAHDDEDVLSLELLWLKDCSVCGSQRSKGLMAKTTFIPGEP